MSNSNDQIKSPGTTPAVSGKLSSKLDIKQPESPPIMFSDLHIPQLFFDQEKIPSDAQAPKDPSKTK